MTRILCSSHEGGEAKKDVVEDDVRSSSRQQQPQQQDHFTSIISQLKRLKVSPLSDLQRRRRRQQTQRELRTRIRLALERTPAQEGSVDVGGRSAKVSSSTSSPPKGGILLLRDSKLSAVTAIAGNHRHHQQQRLHRSLPDQSSSSSKQQQQHPAERRHRHSSDSAFSSVLHLPYQMTTSRHCQSPPLLHHTVDSNGFTPLSMSSASAQSLQDFSKCWHELDGFAMPEGGFMKTRASFVSMQSRVNVSAAAVVIDDDDEDHEDVVRTSSSTVPPPSTGEGTCTSSSCAQQARQQFNDISVDDLAGYLEDSIVFPKKMSYMAEMMYT